MENVHKHFDFYIFWSIEFTTHQNVQKKNLILKLLEKEVKFRGRFTSANYKYSPIVM